MWQPSPEGECRDAPQFWCDFGRNSGQFSGFLKLKHALQMSGMMSIDMVHQLHHHDWAKNTLKTSNRTCNDLTSCLYVPCFSVANMLTLQTYFSTSLRMLCSVIQSLRFLWLLCGNIKSEKICPGNQPHFVPWNLHCHECVFVATLQRNCQIGSVKLNQYTSRPLFLPHERLPRYKNVSQPGQTSGKLKACCWTLGKWTPSSGEMRNIEKPLHSYDIYFGHEKTCCCDIILVLMEWFAHCMPSAQVIQEDLLYRTWNTKTIKTSPTVHCSTWTCSSMSISPAQTDWR